MSSFRRCHGEVVPVSLPQPNPRMPLAQMDAIPVPGMPMLLHFRADRACMHTLSTPNYLPSL